MKSSEKVNERESVEIQREKLSYEKIKIILSFGMLITNAFNLCFTLYSGYYGIIQNFWIVLVLFTIVSFFLGIGLFRTSKEKKFDWTKAIDILEEKRCAIEAILTTSKPEAVPAVVGAYESYLRGLYLVAKEQGKNEFAEEIWTKGQLKKR